MPNQVTSVVSGGGWFLDQSDQWLDTIGDTPNNDTFYQDYWGVEGCTITGPQDMHIDSRLGPVNEPFEPYTSNTLMPVDINPTQLRTGVQPEGGSMVSECENYPSLKGKCH